MQMRCLIFARALLVATVLLTPLVPTRAEPSWDAHVAHMLQGVLPAVVNVTTFKTATSGERRGQWIRSLGSGFIIDPDGVIVTNQHVIQDGEAIVVTFADRTQALATVIADAGVVDLAILKVHVRRKLPTLAFGDSDKVRIGDTVFTIGNALGLGVSVSEGIVSALDRNIRTSPYDAYLQTDAVLNHGNSGGPLVDLSGKVVGVDTALISPTTGYAGLGFAIPSEDAQFIIRRLRKYGTVRAGWIGVQLQDVTARLADGLGLSQPQGGIVLAVEPHSPAAQAAVELGDVVTAVGGTQCANARQAMRLIGRTPVGQHTTLTVIRNGAERRIEVAIVEFPGDLVPHKPPETGAALAAIAGQPDFGIKVAEVTEATNTRYQMDMKSGAAIVAVDPESAAGAAGLTPGEVILRVDDMPVANPDEFMKAVEAARKLGRHYVLMLVQKKDERQWVGVFSKPFALPAP
jgi:serine protease Do